MPDNGVRGPNYPNDRHPGVGKFDAPPHPFESVNRSRKKPTARWRLPVEGKYGGLGNVHVTDKEALSFKWPWKKDKVTAHRINSPNKKARDRIELMLYANATKDKTPPRTFSQKIKRVWKAGKRQPGGGHYDHDIKRAMAHSKKSVDFLFKHVKEGTYPDHPKDSDAIKGYNAMMRRAAQDPKRYLRPAKADEKYRPGRKPKIKPKGGPRGLIGLGLAVGASQFMGRRR